VQLGDAVLVAVVRMFNGASIRMVPVGCVVAEEVVVAMQTMVVGLLLRLD
jgi:hypothetical protein